MAADAELGLTGKDVAIELLIDGVPVGINGQVTNFSENPEYDIVERKHLGTNDRDIDHIPTGWGGDMEVTSKSGNVEDLIDAYNLARRNRVPVEILLHVAKFYRNGTSRRHTYRCVNLTFNTSVSRGDAMTHSITWTSGVERITT